jgi:hypothetical protein
LTPDSVGVSHTATVKSDVTAISVSYYSNSFSLKIYLIAIIHWDDDSQFSGLCYSYFACLVGESRQKKVFRVFEDVADPIALCLASFPAFIYRLA